MHYFARRYGRPLFIRGHKEDRFNERWTMISSPTFSMTEGAQSWAATVVVSYRGENNLKGGNWGSRTISSLSNIVSVRTTDNKK